jgi:hypothetical protein
MKLKLFFATLIIITVFLSACDVYETLYNVPSPVGEVVKVPEENIVVEEEDSVSELVEEEETEEFVSIEDLEEILEEEVEEELVIEDGVIIIEGDSEEVGEVEEIAEEEPVMSEEEVEAATVIIVEESELISLVTQAEDPDQDSIEFIFSNPLDENGEWQTTYGDSGEYTVTITVSDGELTSSKDVLIIVNKKEEAPTIGSFTPVDTAVAVDETDTVEFSVEASDLNDDDLSYEWKLDGVGVSDDDFFDYETTYDDSGSHTVKVTVFDDVFSTDNLWSITINNVNRKPILEEIVDMTVRETETVSINPVAVDPDGDEITFTISDPVGGDDVWETTYDDAGEYVVTVTASDGIDEVSQEVTIVVENVNRAPQIIDIIQK